MTSLRAWPRLALDELCDLQIGRTPPRAEPKYWGPGHPWLSIADMNQGRDLITTKETITDAAVGECNCRPVSPGTLVLSFKLSVGKVGIVKKTMFTNEAIAALRFRQPTNVDTAYMYHALRALDFSGLGERAVKGITLNLRSLGSVKVPVPPPAEQRRIAAVLDKADAIRRKRRESVRLLDEFLRSAFLEMFGDPVRNEKGWDRKRLRDIAVVTTGNTPPRSHSEYYGDMIEWIKSDNINTPGHYVTRAKEGLSLRGRQLGRTVGGGAILMTCIAGTKDCIGNVAVTDREVAFNQQINAVEPRPDVDHRFIYVQFLVGKGLVQRASTDSMKGMVSKSRLEDVQVVNPPSHMQQKFGEWFTRWHAVYSKQCQAADTAEALFDSLAQRAFRGQL